MLPPNQRYFCENLAWTVDITSGVFFYNGDSLRDMRKQPTRVILHLVKNPYKVISVKELYSAMKNWIMVGDENMGKALKDCFRYLDEICHEFVGCVEHLGSNGYRFNPTRDIMLSTIANRDNNNCSDAVCICNPYWGRDADKAQLRENAFRETPLFVLSGEAGIGKSELARAFIKDCMKEDIVDRLCYRVVLWATFEKDIKTTVASLPGDAFSPYSDFDRNIRALEMLPKPALLVIDNADTITREDMAAHNPCVQRLLNTGCHILLTSKLDLKDYHPRLCQYEVRPISSDALTKLFLQKAHVSIPQDQLGVVKELVDVYLGNNTYLTVLVAGLTKHHSPTEIKKWFEEITVADEEDTYVEAQKDGELSKSLKLIKHFNLLYTMTDLDQAERTFLQHLVLFPIEGVPRDWFIARIDPKEKGNMYRAQNDLERRYFCFAEMRNGVWYIRMQPVMREIILRNSYPKLKVQAYLKNLIRDLDDPHYNLGLPQALRASTAAVNALRILGENILLSNEKVPLYTQLLCQIVSVYKILENRAVIMEYANEAAEWLAKIQPQEWTWENHRDDILLFLTACNNLGHPLTNIGKTDLATTVFQKAMDVMKPLKDKMLSDDTFAVKASKLYNNWGANYLKARDYEKALEIHQEVLKHRQVMIDKDPEDAERKALLAASYKAIGTDKYYLKAYEEAFRHHEKAVELYRDSLGEDSLDCVTALNRMVGAGICSGDTERYGQWLRQLDRGLRYLKSIEFVEGEVVNAVKHATTIVSNAQSFKEEGIEILKLANAFPKTKELTEAIKALEDVL